MQQQKKQTAATLHEALAESANAMQHQHRCNMPQFVIAFSVAKVGWVLGCAAIINDVEHDDGAVPVNKI